MINLQSINDKKDFWAFYNDNKKDIERIIFHTALRYSNVMDPKDIYMEVLLRLNKSCFIKNFDPSKGKFNTYFMETCKGHIKSIITKHYRDTACNRMVYLDEMKDADDLHYDDQYDTIEYTDCFVEETVAEDLAEKIRIKLLKKGQEYVTIFNKRLEGLKYSEIAEEFGVSIAYIQKKFTDIYPLINSVIGK